MAIAAFVSGVTVLHGQYTLQTEHSSSSSSPLVWLAVNSFDVPFLLKIWPYSGDQPDPVVRASWDRELRYLFRLSSAPQSETRLVVLRDAGIDRDLQAYVMVLAAPGYSTLHQTLKLGRKQFPWLHDLETQSTRADIWRGVRNLAHGLNHLHEQQILHRHLSAACIYLDPDLGPDSMRLGGFEWAIKVGGLHPAVMAPELRMDGNLVTTHTFESDWFEFGSVAAELLAPYSYDLSEARDLESLLKGIEDSSVITADEAELLLRLLDDQPESRLTHGYDVIGAIDRIIYGLDQPLRLLDDHYLGLVVAVGPGTQLSRSLIEASPELNATDIEAQRSFVERDLRTARLVRKANATTGAYILLGNRLGYEIVEYTGAGAARKGLWDLAYCSRDADLRYSSGAEDQRDLRKSKIRVFTLNAARRDRTVVFANVVGWKRFLPRPQPLRQLEERLQRFHDFFRITNQIELILRDAEVFKYRIISHAKHDGVDSLVITEIPRDRPTPSFAQTSGGMIEYLRRQMAETNEGDRVFLGLEESLSLTRHEKAEFWKVKALDRIGNTVTVERVSLKLALPEKEGFLRSLDLFGQMSLIRRRKRAIDRLRSHTFLLESLERPDLVYIDTEVEELPRTIDPSRVDSAKLRALTQIWRTRPIYALQGPPGTGKTTLVAHLLGLIFADDPVAQILVTAQAHAAVDVLREKVTAEIFEENESDESPLAIRLPRSKGQAEDDPDSVPKVTLKMLTRAEAVVQERSEIERRWLAFVRQAIKALQAGTYVGGPAAGMCELVRRSASITYSSTTAGNLEELADSTLSFDWSIIEEAGKAHGFDLVLPLQTGHRWLLIGDQNQLPPYRYRDFEEAIRNIDDVVDALAELPDRAGGLVDIDLMLRWKLLDARPTEDNSSSSKEICRRAWLTWLKTFKHIHDTCGAVVEQRSGDTGGLAPIASMLSHQHRMHPTIAELISVAYYDLPLVSDTQIGGTPLPRVLHPFAVPDAVAGRSILWLDVPWVRDGGQGEIGPPAGLPFISPDEAEAVATLLNALRSDKPSGEVQLKVAVLSPYRQQVKLLQERLKFLMSDPPEWVFSPKGQRQYASTVDSYQGNQADVVIVSLVRNNTSKPGAGLGFLTEAARMNVLFSRAEKLLVLVGSWDFFQYQVSEAAADKHQPLGHWRLALDFLRASFVSNRASKMAVSELITR